MIAALSQSQQSWPFPALGKAPAAHAHMRRWTPRIVERGAIMSNMDQVIPQATQLPILNRLVELVVLGEQDLRWLQEKIGYQYFFIWVVIASIPGFVVTALIRPDPAFGRKTPASC